MAYVPKYKKSLRITEEDICAVRRAVEDKRLKRKISELIKKSAESDKVEFTLCEVEFNKLNFYGEDMQ